MEDKWVAWIIDNSGYVIHFIPPTSQSWAKRKINALFTHEHSEARWTNAEYVLRTEFFGSNVNEPRFFKLSHKEKLELHKFIQNNSQTSRTPI